MGYSQEMGRRSGACRGVMMDQALSHWRDTCFHLGPRGPCTVRACLVGLDDKSPYLVCQCPNQLDEQHSPLVCLGY